MSCAGNQLEERAAEGCIADINDNETSEYVDMKIREKRKEETIAQRFDEKYVNTTDSMHVAKDVIPKGADGNDGSYRREEEQTEAGMHEENDEYVDKEIPCTKGNNTGERSDVKLDLESVIQSEIRSCLERHSDLLKSEAGEHAESTRNEEEAKMEERISSVVTDLTDACLRVWRDGLGRMRRHVPLPAVHGSTETGVRLESVKAMRGCEQVGEARFASAREDGQKGRFYGGWRGSSIRGSNCWERHAADWKNVGEHESCVGDWLEGLMSPDYDYAYMTRKGSETTQHPDRLNAMENTGRAQYAYKTTPNIKILNDDYETIGNTDNVLQNAYCANATRNLRTMSRLASVHQSALVQTTVATKGSNLIEGNRDPSGSNILLRWALRNGSNRKENTGFKGNKDNIHSYVDIDSVNTSKVWRSNSEFSKETKLFVSLMLTTVMSIALIVFMILFIMCSK